MTGAPAWKPSADRQLIFYQGLLASRQTVLIDALQAALKVANPAAVKQQIGTYVPSDVQQVLAAAGIRDEHVFPTPAVLETSPRLLGYYRLLLNVPQKTFYRSRNGLGTLKSMESSGRLTASQKAKLPHLCSVMAAALADLIRVASPTLSARDVNELPLLTLGSQLQGGANNIIGQQAVEAVYQAVLAVVRPYVQSQPGQPVVILNSAGQYFRITKSSDPDINIVELVKNAKHPKIAIEVKGGTDESNAYNRGGEAEKSHTKASAAGYLQRWTIFGMRNVANLPRLHRSSPTTTQWIEATEVMAQAGNDWQRFTRLLEIELNLP